MDIFLRLEIRGGTFERSARLNYLPFDHRAGRPSPVACYHRREGECTLMFDISSRISMPESASKRAGICAAILAMSPVILFAPAASPPVETIVIRSTFDSGSDIARTTSGMFRDEAIDHRGLVPVLIGLGFHVHRFGFRLALLKDDRGFGFRPAS